LVKRHLPKLTFGQDTIDQQAYEGILDKGI
jgi:hypothetical protein